MAENSNNSRSNKENDKMNQCLVLIWYWHQAIIKGIEIVLSWNMSHDMSWDMSLPQVEALRKWIYVEILY
jgi:hypothetical protein